MKDIDSNAVYCMDLVTMYDHIDFKEETVLRLRYRWYGKTHSVLFESDSDLREFVDTHHKEWLDNFRKMTDPNLDHPTP